MYPLNDQAKAQKKVSYQSSPVTGNHSYRSKNITAWSCNLIFMNTYIHTFLYYIKKLLCLSLWLQDHVFKFVQTIPTLILTFLRVYTDLYLQKSSFTCFCKDDRELKSPYISPGNPQSHRSSCSPRRHLYFLGMCLAVITSYL